MIFLSDIQGAFVGEWARPILFAVREETVLIRPPAFTARVYRPVTPARTAGLVIIPGLQPQGINDPRFEVLARSIARQGFTVLAPDIGEFRRFQVTEQGIGAIVQAAQFLIERQADIDTEKIGLYGMSYSAGPTLIAATRAELAGKVAFVISLGGYYHLYHPIDYVLTGTYYLDGKRVTLPPHPWARMIFALNNLDLIAPREDLSGLRAALQCHLRMDGACAQQWETRLSPQGKELLSLILGPASPKLYQRMSGALARVSAVAIPLSPAIVLTPTALKRLRARVYLLHGARDDVIPCSETWRLAQALEQRGHPAYRVLISGGLTHVDSAERSLVWYERLIEGSKLILFLMTLLNEG